MPTPPPVSVDEKLYTPGDLAIKLGLSNDSVLVLLRPGKIWPVVRLNPRVIRIPESSLAAFLAASVWAPKSITETAKAATPNRRAMTKHPAVRMGARHA